MSYRETVISGLEIIRYNLRQMNHGLLADFCDDAIALLKEQEAAEPGIAQDVDGIFATCGNCKKKLWKVMGLEFVVNPDEKPRFCPHCGQAVKWNDTD